MVFSTTLQRVWATALPSLCLLTFVFLFLTTTVSATALPSTASFSGPAARPVPPLTIFTLTPQTLVLNGSFTGDDLRYSATLADGKGLAYWMKFSDADATFSMFAPASTLGEVYHIIVTAYSASGLSAATSFHLTVAENSPDCRVDANSDRLGKILSCAGNTIKLRGEIHNGNYRWTGPNGFTSTEKEPEVTVPGIYVLTTDAAARVSCPTTAIVEVLKLDNCNSETANNILPTVLIKADLTTGVGPLTVRLDGSSTRDIDGSVLRYRWSWDGGYATGVKPVVTFPEGKHEVILTVTDNDGARATDRVTIIALPPPAYTSYWLEAECAQVGSNWTIASSTKASGGDYAMPLRSSTSSAPAAVPENLVRFTVTEAKAGNFQLFARVDAYNNTTDSYYVRVNGGSWYAWTSGIIQGRGFQWNKMPRQLALTAGTNTVEVAYREAKTRLDKVFLTATNETPAGMGEIDKTCTVPNQPPVAIASVAATYGIAPFTVTLDGSASTDVDGGIVDYQWAWAGGSAKGMNAQVTLPVGSHMVTLTVADNAGETDHDELLIVVDAPPAPPIPPTSSEPTIPGNSNEFWLEAECATVGGRWIENTATGASGGVYVVVPNSNSTATAPADVADNRVRFTLAAATAGTYSLFARVNAPSNAMDSYWVRVNGGSWYKWSSGVHRGEGFNWTKLPIGVKLAAGNNTVDFAFREMGTQLDKVYLALNGTEPTGMGAEASNCVSNQTTPDVTPETAVEAECALLNTGWSTRSSSSAAGGNYLVFTGDRHLSTPTDASPGQELRFEVVTTQAGTYQLFLRVDAPDPTRNSVWVQVDNNGWILFWKEASGNQMLTKGFEWRAVNNDGKAISFDLDEGKHTIRLVNRESGTKIDKLYLTTDLTAPTGTGPEAAPCGNGTESVNMQTMFSSTLSTPEAEVSVTPVASIFPNPTVDRLTLELTSAHTGAVDLIIYDMNGRRVRQEQFLKDGTESSTELSVGTLPSGMYQLRVIEGDRATTQSFMRR